MRPASIALLAALELACGGPQPAASESPHASSSTVASPSSASAPPSSAASPAASAAPSEAPAPTAQVASTAPEIDKTGNVCDQAPTTIDTKTLKKRGAVRSGATQVNGRIPPDDIKRSVEQKLAAVTACYEAELARDPKLAG